jgi:gamma-glutamyltranspeptidase/glutathione hydrolase
VIAKNGMVATSHPLATQIGLDILRNGGNAIDAAIAANIALGLMEPTGNGIGGDLFVILWDEDSQKLYGLNASGPSPKSLSIEYFKDNNLSKIPSYGPLPVTVPGAVDGWIKLHERFGSVKFKDLFTPTINYARNGFPITETIAFYLKSSSERFKSYPNFKKSGCQIIRFLVKEIFLKILSLLTLLRKYLNLNAKVSMKGVLLK